MKRGDIYLVSLDPASGREQQGFRSVLIVSHSDFNAATNLPVILPITTGGAFVCRIGFAVEIVGIQTNGYIRCDQPRVIDIAAHNGRKVDTLPSDILEEVLARLIPIFM